MKVVKEKCLNYRTCADKVVSGQGKFEQLIVASQEIAASTAQLVVASRVKADRKSDNLAGLSGASKGVAQATAGVVATAKSCSKLVEESGKSYDFEEEFQYGVFNNLV